MLMSQHLHTIPRAPGMTCMTGHAMTSERTVVRTEASTVPVPYIHANSERCWERRSRETPIFVKIL
jgi:hypothetical protein